MIVLIRAAKVVDPNSKHNNKVVDILVVKGIIQKIGKNLKIPKGAEIIEENGLHVSLDFLIYASILEIQDLNGKKICKLVC